MATLNQMMPLQRAFDEAMDLIDSTEENAALFMLGGRVSGTSALARSFQNNIERLGAALIGVYNLGADARCVREDIEEFYRPDGTALQQQKEA